MLESCTQKQLQDDPDAIDCMNRLAELLVQQKKYGEAEPLLRDAFAGFTRIHGKDDTTTLACLNELMLAVFYQGKVGEAEQLCRELLDGRTRVLGRIHETTLAATIDLSFVLLQQGKLDDADKLLAGAHPDCRSVLGDAHHTTKSCLNLMLKVRRAKSQRSSSSAAPAAPREVAPPPTPPAGRLSTGRTVAAPAAFPVAVVPDTTRPDAITAPSVVESEPSPLPPAAGGRRKKPKRKSGSSKGDETGQLQASLSASEPAPVTEPGSYMRKGPDTEIPLIVCKEDCSSGRTVMLALKRTVAVEDPSGRLDSATGKTFLKKSEREVVEVTIKKGSREASEIRLAGKGNVEPGCLPSDAVLVLMDPTTAALWRRMYFPEKLEAHATNVAEVAQVERTEEATGTRVAEVEVGEIDAGVCVSEKCDEKQAPTLPACVLAFLVSRLEQKRWLDRVRLLPSIGETGTEESIPVPGPVPAPAPVPIDKIEPLKGIDSLARKQVIDNSTTIAGMEERIAVLEKERQFAEMELLCRKLLDAYTLCRDDFKASAVMNKLVLSLFMQGKPEAEALSREAVAGNIRSHGRSDNETLSSMFNLAQVLLGFRKTGEAESLLRETIRFSRVRASELGSLLLDCQDMLSRVLFEDRNYDEAVLISREALNGSISRLGRAHLSTLRRTLTLSQRLVQLKEFGEAHDLLTGALPDCQRVLGNADPFTKRFLEMIRKITHRS